MFGFYKIIGLFLLVVLAFPSRSMACSRHQDPPAAHQVPAKQESTQKVAGKHACNQDCCHDTCHCSSIIHLSAIVAASPVTLFQQAFVSLNGEGIAGAPVAGFDAKWLPPKLN
ncbi:MAG TPA: hypothetical protein PLQ32_03880 [Flavihumibacter sp.]|nr:hypothetical protein [Flavihumibacter sp.]HQD09847.1 hypothetical protein [Flavihumibacter sp.]